MRDGHNEQLLNKHAQTSLRLGGCGKGLGILGLAITQ